MAVPDWVRLIGAPVWISGPDQRIAWLNARAERLLGRRAEECLGQCCHGVVAARDTEGRRICDEDCQVVRQARQRQPLPVRKVAVDERPENPFYLLTIPFETSPGGPLLIVHCAVEASDGHDDVGDGPLPGLRGRLTPREREVLDRLVSGAELRHIGDELGISYSTVRNHVQHILNKLDVHSIREAIVRVLAPPHPPEAP